MKILVTGASGLLGAALVRRGAQPLDRDALDVTDTAAVDACLARLSPDAVIFCAALSRVDACERDPGAWALNAVAPVEMARRVPTWFVSSNYVFDGPGPHHPWEPRRPMNAYARQKAWAEDGVRAAGGHVVRTGWLYGLGGRNFPSRLPQALRDGPVQALRDWPVQPTWAGDVADALLRLPRGTTHAIGRESTTWFDFASAVAERMGLGHRVQGVTRLPVGPRPADGRLAPASLPGWSERLDMLLPPRR